MAVSYVPFAQQAPTLHLLMLLALCQHTCVSAIVQPGMEQQLDARQSTSKLHDLRKLPHRVTSPSAAAASSPLVPAQQHGA
jgi:hypothetical protein